MTQNEFTQWLNLAKALNLIVSSHKINGTMYIYTKAGQPKPLDNFVADYPLERLQAMVARQLS
jgi:hypothetical protein